MTLITPLRKMAEVIHDNCLLIPIVNRFGIRLGFGDKTVYAVCTDAGIDTDFFVTILNTFNNENYFPERRMQAFNVTVFIDYLRRTHRYYLKTQIPIIEDAIAKLIERSHKPDNTLALVRDFFKNYKVELTAHIQREEMLTFPYIQRMSQLYSDEFDAGQYLEVTREYSMKRYQDEHDDIDVKLFDLQNLLVKYIPGCYDPELINVIVFELYRLEKDIRDHTRLEEKILKPMIEEIEKTLKEFVR